jgi:ribonuclease HI
VLRVGGRALQSGKTFQRVANFENRTQMVTKIKILLIEHQNSELVWIPGHSGLLRNEKVDIKTRSVAKRETFVDTTLEYQDFQKSIAGYEQEQKVECG